MESILAQLDDNEEISFFPAQLMRILIKQQNITPARYSALAKAIALKAEGNGIWHQASEYWEVAAEWHKFEKDSESEISSRIHHAETFVRVAECESSSITAAHWLEKAIQCYRKIGGQQERIKELHLLLLDHQKQSVGQLTGISHGFDASELITEAVTKVKGKGRFDALFALATLGKSPNVDQLEEQAKDFREKFIFASLCATTVMNEMGRTVARKPPSDAHETRDLNLVADMYNNAGIARAIQVQACIEPAREQINLEHHVQMDDFGRIVKNSPFVPEGREGLFARGLQAGMQGDFATAVHLLVPQIENSIRNILTQQGVITSKLDDEGIQDECDLNSTLCLAKYSNVLTQIFGKDLLFDLRGLLVERFGANLRNEMAHGLMRYEAFYSYSCCYLWWLTLRLCCLPIIISLQHSQQEAPDTNSDNEPL